MQTLKCHENDSALYHREKTFEGLHFTSLHFILTWLCLSCKKLDSIESFNEKINKQNCKQICSKRHHQIVQFRAAFIGKSEVKLKIRKSNFLRSSVSIECFCCWHKKSERESQNVNKINKRWWKDKKMQFIFSSKRRLSLWNKLHNMLDVWEHRKTLSSVYKALSIPPTHAIAPFHSTLKTALEKEASLMSAIKAGT